MSSGYRPATAHGVSSMSASRFEALRSVARHQRHETVEAVRLREVDAEMHEHALKRLLGGLLGMEAGCPLDPDLAAEDDFGDSQVVAGLREPSGGAGVARSVVTHDGAGDVLRASPPVRPCREQRSGPRSVRGR